jgi:enoyl-CoA hydratase/carnithine racemase
VRWYFIRNPLPSSPKSSWIPAAQALAMGLINRVVPGDEVMATARALAGRMAGNGPLVMRQAKQVMLESSGRSLGEAFEAEDEAIKVVLRSADAREGSRAFIDKRPPPLHRRLTWAARGRVTAAAAAGAW